MALQPAPDRPAFAVLLLMAVLGHDEFRLQRHHPVVIGRHDRRRHQRVEVLGPVLAALAGRALLAMDLARHVIFGAVQGDQHVAAKLAESLQAAGPLQFRHHLGEDRMEVVGADRVQQRPDMIVAGDPVQAEQRLAVRAPLSLLQTALVRQERRALHEEQGKRRQADVRHRIARIASLPEVRQRVAAPAQCPEICTWSETPAWFRTKLSVASDASIALSFSDVSDAHHFFTSPSRSSDNLDYRANPPHGRNTDIGCR